VRHIHIRYDPERRIQSTVFRNLSVKRHRDCSYIVSYRLLALHLLENDEYVRKCKGV
jgi:hypothetical protein